MTPTPDPPQTEAETLIARLHEMGEWCANEPGRGPMKEPTCTAAANFIEAQQDQLTTALRERDEAIQQATKTVEFHRGMAERFAEDRDAQKHLAREYKARAEAAERERDEANKRASAALDRQAHWESLAREQQDQITTLRAALERLANYNPNIPGTLNCVFCGISTPHRDDCLLTQAQAAMAADRSPRHE